MFLGLHTADLPDMAVILGIIALALVWTGIRGAWVLLGALTGAPTFLVFLAVALVASYPGYLAAKSPAHPRDGNLLGASLGLWSIILVPGFIFFISANAAGKADCEDRYEKATGPFVSSYDASYEDWASGFC